MPSSYSYLDVAVLDPVRRRFAAGDALAILSSDLGRALWANGPGAALFGYRDIDAVMAAGAVLPPVARRQLAATSGFPEIGRDRAVMLRLASGMASHAAGLLASAVIMPDGEKAILLAVPAAGTDPSEAAGRAVSGLTQAGEFFALLDEKGAVEAASEGFGALGISGETLAALVEDVTGEADRLVKRRIAAGSGSYPAGLARLVDEPARHLLVVVDDGGSAGAEPEIAAAEPENAVPESESPEPADTASALDAPPARIDGNAAPVRFVWRTDAEGAFSTISPDFAAVVGKRAAAIVGRRFGEVAAAFGLDPSGEIVQLLERRDTWSGRTLQWPAADGRRVPVDLAALPVYSRDRVFEGFRGFGVARPADAVSDPAAAALFAVVRERSAIAPQEPPMAGADTAPPADPFEGEVPALAIAPQPDRRFTDKVIRLAEHRPALVDKALSSGERSAFREIGERLKKDSAAQVPDAAKPSAGAVPTMEPAAEAAPLGPATQPGRLAGGEVGVEPPPARPGSLLKYAETDVDVPEADDGADDSMAAADFADARDDETLPSAFETQAKESAAAEADEPPASEASETPANEKQPAEPGDDADVGRPRMAAPPLRTQSVVPSAFATAQDRAPDTSILAKLPVPLLVHSGDILHYANDEFLDLTDYGTLDDLAEAGGLDELFADPYADDGAADRTGRSLRLRARDGREFSVDALLRAVPWRGGKALMLVLRRAGDAEAAQESDAAPASRPLPGEPTQPDAAELKARVAEMRTIIDTATDGVVLIGRDGAIRSISRPAEALFGFDSDEVAGKPFASLFAIESQRAAGDYLASLSEPGVASVLNDGREVIGREAQGRFIPLFMTIGRLPGDSGHCAVVRDITQWKRAEEDLTQARAVAERASSQKTDFLARISHEIRTPLNAIIGFSELMVDEKFGPVANDRYRDYLRDINRSGNHVLDLVNDLLDISKIEAGQQEMDYEAVSLNDTLAETVAMMQPQANRERVIIRSSLASRLPDVVADLRSVRQIALNILSNAIRYTQAGGQVIVSTAYEPSGDVVMRVRDTGVGMTQAEIEQALKPFKQLNALKRGRGDGTGLGLPLTKAMVEANRARFAIHSTPGEGTLVEVAFPSTRVLAE